VSGLWYHLIVQLSHLIFPRYWCKLYAYWGNKLRGRESSPRSLAFAVLFTAVAPRLHRPYRNSGATVVIAAQAVQATMLMASELDSETGKGYRYGRDG